MASAETLVKLSDSDTFWSAGVEISPSPENIFIFENTVEDPAQFLMCYSLYNHDHP